MEDKLRELSKDISDVLYERRNRVS